MRLRSYWSVLVIYLVLFITVSVVIRATPGDMLDWLLFAVIALGLKVEGGVMGTNTTRKRRWTPTVLVLVLMRLLLGAYFLWAAGLAYFDPDRTWRADHQELVYIVRSIALVGVLAELVVIPYKVRPDVDLGDFMSEPSKKETA